MEHCTVSITVNLDRDTDVTRVCDRPRLRHRVHNDPVRGPWMAQIFVPYPDEPLELDELEEL